MKLAVSEREKVIIAFPRGARESSFFFFVRPSKEEITARSVGNLHGVTRGVYACCCRMRKSARVRCFRVAG